ncbi:RNA helicase [Gracilaria domingensis]|nr:RNA helicase [Gracilaria domingensis]
MNSIHSEPKRIQFELCSIEDGAENVRTNKKAQKERHGCALDPRLQDELASQLGICKIFHMQAVMLSYILTGASRGRVGDVVLCAPTGSGKTLAYALPIVQDMLDRIMPRLRAIIVVPTRDLAAQVFSVFSKLTKKFGIFVLCVVEILIATPGRLVDHINNGDYMNLGDVRYLVLDESDRLLEDSYQEWIDVLIPALGKQKQTVEGDESGRPMPYTSYGLMNLAIRPDISMRTESSYSGLSQPNVRKILASATQTRNPMRLYKLDLRDVCFFEPVDSQGNQAGAIDVLEEKYTVPATMTEYGWIIENVQQKPLALLQLLGWIPFASEDEKVSRRVARDRSISQGGTKLVFTNSVDSAHRLCRLLEICAHSLGRNGVVLEMSGTLSVKRRKYVLDAVRKEISSSGRKDHDHNPAFVVVVCSDVLARGMDILTVDTVINYDSPVHISTYLHRAGRTARAGRKGNVFTLLIGNQVRHFRTMVYEAKRDDKKVRTIDMKVQSEEASKRSLIVHSLASLRRVMNSERYGALHHEESLPEFMLYALNHRGANHESYLEYEEDESEIKRRKLTTDGISQAEQDEENEEQNESTLHEVLFAQIGRNLLHPVGRTQDNAVD